MNGKAMAAWMVVPDLMVGSSIAAEPPPPGPKPRPDPAKMSIADISACMRANVVDRGSMRDFEIESTDREGKANSFKAKLFWKPVGEDDETRMTLQVLEANLSTLLEVEPRWLILGDRMQNLDAGTRTDLELSDLFLLESLPSSLFTPEAFSERQE